ncbi:DegT/DnrJ/EryC1/StrS family aminotransferase [Candidatus Woesearchaeota archaeon]|nr:DegT/DnrJ/EryC1/StrS family aminotransferase [Candidatus Woesearchaeota archaeon]
MIRLTIPDVRFENLSRMKDVVNSGWLTQGKVTEEFEAKVSGFVGTKFGIAVNSGTSALHLALLALGIKPGDEVIVPDYTFVASANTVVHAGAKPVLADINLDTFNISIEDMERRITERTRAIMPVHQFGLSAEMDKIRSIAEKNNLLVVEDAACALGTEYKGKRCGSLTDIGCFSFHPRKILTTGEGGMITTGSREMAYACASLRNHGLVLKEGKKEVIAAGYNFRMSEINAVLGIEQMERIGEIIESRQRMARIMNEGLEGVDLLQTPKPTKNSNHVYQSYVVLLDEKVNREKLIREMAGRGIETTAGAMAVHCQPYYIRNFQYGKEDLKNSYTAFMHSMTLPLYPRMSDENAAKIIASLKSCIRECIK